MLKTLTLILNLMENNLTLIETMQINSNPFSRCRLIFILLTSKINVIPRMLEKKWFLNTYEKIYLHLQNQRKI